MGAHRIEPPQSRLQELLHDRFIILPIDLLSKWYRE
jgi:hypothetical protein